jgi:hypothetical protein
MEVTKVLDRPASHSFYAVAGRLLFSESLNLRLRNLIEQLFAGWQLTPVSSPKQAPDIRISFFCDTASPQIPPDLNQFEIAGGGQCYTDGADFYLALENSLIHLQNSKPLNIEVWFGKLPDPRDPDLARAASFAVCAGLRRHGLFDLHSAGVVHPHTDKGVVIIGPSGSGKSTLALQLAVAGWPYLSDDELLLSLVDGEIEARAFRSFFAVTNATALAAEIPGFDTSAQLNSRFKTCFDPGIVIGPSRRERTVPGLLFFVELSGKQRTGLNKLTQAETMMKLVRACPWATYDTAVAAANLSVLSKLARQTSAFDLRAGRDLLQPGCASELLLTPKA